ncbi:histidine kinase dimerization/phospho-acceptor domain-containing protein [Lysobacter yangpyeongensis]|uniref:histidine kinase n=1 Tax=Lysobacter yangpyeongensis TaxID=346182 RepID=A0ABW0SRG8_9GAMM
MTHPDWFQRVAHDLRDPLSPLQTAVYLLRSGEISDDDRSRMLELIERQGVRLAGMIDELSDCLRAERGRLLARRTEVDLLVLATLGIARADAAPLQFDPDVVALAMLGDDRRLLQLLRILRELRLSPEEVLPAPLFVERRGRTVRLHRRLACLPDFLEDPARLLDAPLPAALGPGLGLQLPLAASIAREHDGQLRAEADADGRVALVAELPLLA